jgi:hypothetical protein
MNWMPPLVASPLSCGMQILSKGRELGIVRGLPDGGVLKMNAFE